MDAQARKRVGVLLVHGIGKQDELQNDHQWGCVSNWPRWGMGGFARAHLLYQKKPSFLRVTAGCIFGRKILPESGTLHRAGAFCLSILESLGILFALSLALVLGIMVSTIPGYIIVKLLSYPFQWAGLESLASGVVEYGTWSFAGFVIVALLLASLSRATGEHGYF
jgi:hypothetical protein